jgi:alditol oxidase
VTRGPAGRTNWAGNVAYRAGRHHTPTSVEELQHLVAASRRLRPLGTGHSFNALADTDGDQVSVTGLPPTIDVHAAEPTATIAAGLRYGELTGRLHEQGWALHNLGSLPHISVAGAVATATHGSGEGNGNLASSVRALQMVTADGELVTLQRGRDSDFAGAVVALGALGVVVRLTLDLVPAFTVRQFVYEGLTLDRLLECFDDVVSAAYSVSVFTDWRDPVQAQVWVKQRVGEESRVAVERWPGARLADGPRHPIGGMPPENCTPQLGVPGPWHDRLPHFKLGFTPSGGKELQSEYFVARSSAAPAIEALARIRGQVAPLLQTAEIRTVAADDLWLSPAYRRDSVALHFTWVADEAAVAPVVSAVEEVLAPFDARPHWGKVFGVQPDVVAAGYERWQDFVTLAERLDPAGVLRNELLASYLLPSGAGRRPFAR